MSVFLFIASEISSFAQGGTFISRSYKYSLIWSPQVWKHSSLYCNFKFCTWYEVGLSLLISGYYEKLYHGIVMLFLSHIKMPYVFGSISGLCLLIPVYFWANTILFWMQWLSSEFWCLVSSSLVLGFSLLFLPIFFFFHILVTINLRLKVGGFVSNVLNIKGNTIIYDKYNLKINNSQCGDLFVYCIYW